MVNVLKLYQFLLIFCVLWCGIPEWGFAKAISDEGILLDRMVAVVNDQLITQRQLDQQIMQWKKHVNTMKMALPEPSEIRPHVLDQLINRALQLQIADRVGIVVTNREVEHAMQRILKQQRDFQSRQDQQDIKKVQIYRDAVRKDLTITKLQQAAVGSRVRINPKQITDAWQDYLRYMHQQTRYRVRSIFVAVSDRDDRQKRQEKYKQAQHLSHLQRQNKLPTTVSGSTFVKRDWPVQALSTFPKAFEKALNSMKVGQVSDPIQTGNGYHVLYLLEKQEPDQKMTRLQIATVLYQKKMIKEVKHWLVEQRQQAYIKMFD